MRRTAAAATAAALAAPAMADPAFTTITDAAALSFGLASVALIAVLGFATRLALRGPKR